VRLAEAVGLLEGCKPIVLGRWKERSHVVDHGGADVDDALRFGKQRSPAHVRGSLNVDAPESLQRPPNADHGREVKYAIHAAHRGGQAFRVDDVSAKDLHISIFEPGRILVWKREHSHTGAVPLQRRHEATPEETVPTRN